MDASPPPPFPLPTLLPLSPLPPSPPTTPTACLLSLLYDWTSNHTLRRDPHLHSAAFSLTFLLLSLLIAFAGDRLTVSVLSLSGFASASILGIGLVGGHAASVFEEEGACSVVLFLVVCFGVLGGAIGSQLYKIGSLAFGCLFGFAAMLHLLDAVPVAWNEAGIGPVLLGRRVVPFWSLVLAASLLAGGYAGWMRKEVGVLVTSSLGAWGVVFASRSLASMYGAAIEGWAAALLFGSTCAAGMWTQNRTQRRARDFVARIQEDARHREEQLRSRSKVQLKSEMVVGRGESVVVEKPASGEAV